jgi:hypothetical protein
MIEVCLEDQGPGIPRDELARIFEKFRQVDDTTVEKPAGTGLGLAICREIITLHGGRVWVRSVTGRGASFFFTVPVAKEVESPKKPAKKKMSIADKVRAAAEMARSGDTSELVDIDVELILKGGSEEPEPNYEPEHAVAGTPEIDRPLTAEISGELPPLQRPDAAPNLPPMLDV